jgi:hypothetical protein
MICFYPSFLQIAEIFAISGTAIAKPPSAAAIGFSILTTGETRPN